MVFISAAIYPTFTYGDFPERWVTDNEARKELVRGTDNHRKELWYQIEKQVSGNEWFLGSSFSALDVYLSVMTRWRPRRLWFQSDCPDIYRIARSVDQISRLEDIWSRNFDA
jgi:GST-like protein